MPIRMSLLWIDVGMASFVAAFVVIYLFVGPDIFAPIMIGYMLALVVWAFVAERAIMREESREDVSLHNPTRNAGSTEPLTH